MIFVILKCPLDFNFIIFYNKTDGWVAEWSNAPVLKTGEGASLPGVRIPPHPPPYYHVKIEMSPY